MEVDRIGGGPSDAARNRRWKLRWHRMPSLRSESRLERQPALESGPKACSTKPWTEAFRKTERGNAPCAYGRMGGRQSGVEAVDRVDPRSFGSALAARRPSRTETERTGIARASPPRHRSSRAPRAPSRRAGGLLHGSPPSSTGFAQDIHRLSTLRDRERMNSPLPTHNRHRAPTQAFPNFPPSPPHLFQELGSGVRTRAPQLDMTSPLAASNPCVAVGDPALGASFAVPARGASLVNEDPFPERTRPACTGTGAGWTASGASLRVSNGGLLANGLIPRELESARALGHRARNALPEVVRPVPDPIPPSTRVRSPRASRTWAEASPRASGMPALLSSRTAEAPRSSDAVVSFFPRPSAGALTETRSAHSDSMSRAAISNSETAMVSARRSPTGPRSAIEVTSSGLVRRRAPNACH